jgi:hypothetical protein
MIDQRGLERRNRKAERDAERPKRDDVRHDLPAQQHRGKRAERREPRCRPQ